ncbi:MAG: hypothetical protein ACI4TJ_07390 [Candidatus Cryptobacteroides sp.]
MLKRICSAGLALLGIAAFLSVSCKNEEIIEPVFPGTVVEKTMSPGETIDLKFNANLDWTLKVSGEGAGNYFGIFDDGMLETSVSGAAGNQVVKVGFTEDVEFDCDRVCTVTLTMKETSKDIAILTRMRGERVLQVFAAIPLENGFPESGIEYSDTPATGLALQTFPGSMEYSLPVKVVSNFGWTLNTGSDFVHASVSESTEEVTELLLTLDTDESLAQGSTLEMLFNAAGSSDSFSIPVGLTVPAFADRLEVELVSSLYFNRNGELKMPTGGYSMQPAIMYVLGGHDYELLTVEWNAEKEYYEVSLPKWIAMCKEFNSDGYLQKSTLGVMVMENEGSDRYADLLVLPPSLGRLTPAQVCDEQGLTILPQYQQYLVGRLVQEGVRPDFIGLDSSADNYKADLQKSPEDCEWLKKEYGTDQVYKLTYSDPYSIAQLTFTPGFKAYDIKDYNLSNVSGSFWLELNPFARNTRGLVYMDPSAYKAVEGENPTSFIVFYSDEQKENVMGVLSCVYDTEATGGSEGGSDIISISSGSGLVTRLSAGNEVFDIISSNLGISEVYDVTVTSRKTVLKSTVELWGGMIYGLDFMELTDGTFTAEGYSETEIAVKVSPSVTEFSSCLIILTGAGESPVAALYFSFDPSGSN